VDAFPPSVAKLSARARGLLLPFPIATAVFYTVIGIMPMYLVSAYALRLQRDLGFGTAELGYTVSACFVAAGVGSMTLGPLIDRVGTAVGLRTASIGSAVAVLAVALVASNWLMVAAALAISGLSHTIGQLTCNSLLTREVASGSQGKGFAGKQAAIPFAALLAGLLVWLLGASISWRATFISFAVVCLAAAALTPSSLHVPKPIERQRRRLGHAAAPLTALAMAGAFAALASNSLAVLAVDAFATAGFSEAAAARVLFFGSAAAIAARTAVGWDIDRRRASGFRELTLMMAFGSTGFLLLAIAGGSRPILFGGALLAFAAGWGWPAVIYFTAATNSGIPPATATAFALSGVYVGTVIGPPVFGLIAEHTGYPTAWAFGAAALAVGSVMTQVSRSLTARAVPQP
jgi:predicted MFS family arabinose efflux permease